MIRYDSPLTAADNATIAEHHLTYIGYLPYNAILVAGRGDDAGRLRGTANVEWVVPFDSSLRSRPAFAPLAGSDYVTIQVANVPQATDSLASIKQVARQIDAIHYVGSYIDVQAQVALSDEPQLLDDPLVIAVERTAHAVPSGEREAIALTRLTQQYAGEPYQDGTRPFKPSTDYRAWLTNRGLLDTSTYRIAIADSGLDGNAQSIRPKHPDLVRSNMVLQSYITGQDASDAYGHGTAVAGMALGDPTSAPSAGMTPADADGFLYGMGVAPKTGIYVQKILSDTGSLNTTLDLVALANDAYLQGAAVQNHSYEEVADQGYYPIRSQTMDFAVRDTNSNDSIDTPMPMTVASGNASAGPGVNALVASPGTAKNVITVGGSEGYRPNIDTCDPGIITYRPDMVATSLHNVASISRRGTVDGRVKPDIVAPATLVSTTRTQYQLAGTAQNGAFCVNTSDGYYIIQTGTSFAAPQVAGAAVLLEKKKARTLSPAMLKAALIGNSLSLSGGIDRRTGATIAPRPNSIQGFGRLYLGDVSGTVQTFYDEDAWTPFTSAGQATARRFTISNTSQPARVVVAWTDEPGIANTTNASLPTLVRDLDVDVSVDGCHRYTGNQLTTGEVSALQTDAACGGSPIYDRANNVEIIVIPPNTGATFILNIDSTSWSAGGHNQKYAVFAANAF